MMNWGKGKLLGIDTTIAFNDDTILGLYFCGDANEMMLDFDLEPSDERSDKAASLLRDIESGTKAIKFEFIAPSEFEKAVWNELCNIEFGQMVTYSDIAVRIGRPAAVRAVASAIGRNPISYIVPCHRVVRIDGSLGGYRWGLDVKRALLEREVPTGTVRMAVLL